MLQVLTGQRAVTTTEKDQRRAGLPPGKPDHSPDEDRVVAAIVARLGFAFEDGQRLGQRRRPKLGRQQIDALQRVRARSGQPRRDIFMGGAEHADREACPPPRRSRNGPISGRGTTEPAADRGRPM